MRHLRFVLCALIVLVSLAAHADSIPVFQITDAYIEFLEGGTAGYTFIGPGINIHGGAAFECPSGWCGMLNAVPQGTPIDFGSFVPIIVTIQIGGTTYFDPQAALNAFTLDLFSASQVPDCCAAGVLNGNGLIPGSINTANGTLQFEIKVPAGSLGLSWAQSTENPSNYNLLIHSFFEATASPSPVPEPGSVVLLATGLAGILSAVKFKQRH